MLGIVVRGLVVSAISLAQLATKQHRVIWGVRLYSGARIALSRVVVKDGSYTSVTATPYSMEFLLYCVSRIFFVFLFGRLSC